jgi:hypothetical protein
MGYIKIDDFSDLSKWRLGIPTDKVVVGELDWPSLMSSSKPSTMAISFYGDLDFPNYIEKKYPYYIEFSTNDATGSTVNFNELVLTIWAQFKLEKLVKYTKPSQFHLSLSLHDNEKKLIEWFIPLSNTVGYEQLKFDLMPLIEKDVTKFNILRINILKSSLGTTIYFGDLYIFQDDVEHNIKVSIAKRLHLSWKKKLTKLKKHALMGDDTIVLESNKDVDRGLPILIGTETINELHIVANEPNSRNPVKFTDMFDGNKMIMTFPVNTPVYETVVAVFGDLSQTEQFYSAYYISTKAPKPVEERSDIVTRFDSYIRDPLGKHKVACRKSIDTSVIAVEIHIYATTYERATDMWKHLRSIFDDQSFIKVAGEDVQYEITAYDQVSQDPDVTESIPHYVLNLNCYVWENVYSRVYGNFPYLKSANIDIDSVPWQSVEFRKKLT